MIIQRNFEAIVSFMSFQFRYADQSCETMFLIKKEKILPY